MAKPTDRTSLAAYCLRKLGSPVIQINVDPTQIDDRIDDALELYAERHFDGVEKVYFKHQITSTDITNKYVQMPDNITGAINIFPVSGSGGRTGDIFDIQYQIALNDLYNLTTVSIVPYVLTMTHLEAMNQILVGQMPFRYNKVGNKFYVDTDWHRFNVGDYLVIEAYQVVDSTQFATMWKDRWFISYTTALIKRQWGTNLSKFKGMQLPGGIVMNGDEIFQQAEQEVKELLDELQDRYTAFPSDYFG